MKLNIVNDGYIFKWIIIFLLIFWFLTVGEPDVMDKVVKILESISKLIDKLPVK